MDADPCIVKKEKNLSYKIFAGFGSKKDRMRILYLKNNRIRIHNPVHINYGEEADPFLYLAYFRISNLVSSRILCIQLLFNFRDPLLWTVISLSCENFWTVKFGNRSWPFPADSTGCRNSTQYRLSKWYTVQSYICPVTTQCWFVSEFSDSKVRKQKLNLISGDSTDFSK